MDVVVAVDIWVRRVSLKVGLRARPRRLVAARAGKSHWLAKVLKAYDGRSAIEATMEPSASERGRSGSEMLDERVRFGMSAEHGRHGCGCLRRRPSLPPVKKPALSAGGKLLGTSK